MPCCGGKKGGKPISRTQYAVGRVLFTFGRVTLWIGLQTVGRVSPRFREIARFWELLSADWEEAIANREGIAFLDEETEAEACALPPPSHADATAGDAGFGLDWGDDPALFDDAARA